MKLTTMGMTRFEGLIMNALGDYKYLTYDDILALFGKNYRNRRVYMALQKLIEKKLVFKNRLSITNYCYPNIYSITPISETHLYHAQIINGILKIKISQGVNCIVEEPQGHGIIPDIKSFEKDGTSRFYEIENTYKNANRINAKIEPYYTNKLIDNLVLVFDDIKKSESYISRIRDIYKQKPLKSYIYKKENHAKSNLKLKENE